jgi:predicted aldo/keto reductase-like oxidoreductase
MKYRMLGKTGLRVSEIGLGGEWLERHDAGEVKEVVSHAEECGINMLDCWMSNPVVRTNLGDAMRHSREKWHIQGHIGSTWQNGQYVKARDLSLVKPAFEDYLKRFHTDHIDLGMIHFVDEETELKRLFEGEYLQYVQSLKKEGKILHIGLSTHNPRVGLLAAQSGIVEMLLFSINPAFDLLPPTEDLNTYFKSDYGTGYQGIAPERRALYDYAEQHGIGINVMKGYAGGRLFKADLSPFSVAFTPVQCLHYALTRPAVSSVLVGCETVAQIDEAVHYETASDEEKDYATVLASAPKNAFHDGRCTYCGHCAPCPKHIDVAMVGKLYDLAVMQEDVPSAVKAHYDSLEAHAGDCVSCKACEKRCPFHVNVTERMEKAKALFGR